MTKRLIVCCDGTWNVFGQKHPTNVVKLYEAIGSADDDGVRQERIYVAGVGTKPWQRIRGGVLGWGLSKNLKEAYRKLVEAYEPGDEIFLFGFSRGAYTARSLGGFIRNSGILKREHMDQADAAFDLYRDRDKSSAPRQEQATEFRQKYSHETPIRFIGVWDTVGSLGIPIDGWKFAEKINRRWAFHDTQLSTTVQAAYHALAIDEKRRPFGPTLWTPQPDRPEGQIIEQVWFSGVHCNVGGGYADSRISDIPLVWMMGRARHHGLFFSENPVTGTPVTTELAATSITDVIARFLNSTDAFAVPLQESRKGFYRAFKPLVRQLGSVDGEHEYAASSAKRRLDRVDTYDPANLIAYQDAKGREMLVDSHPIDS
ncbi:DUF2235 domain-containing protein [Gordonia sp. CPCC 205515]|uniref:DUF2235 domain-containing protein n=1 Tax=Gordonia sp. CPCC 205515 TaxID=3140791 RepID=UPI003AF4017B